MGWVTEVVGAFHCGLRAGPGRTTTLGCGGDALEERPYLRVLAAAGLGGLLLLCITGVLPAHAAAPTRALALANAGAPGSATAAGPVTLVQLAPGRAAGGLVDGPTGAPTMLLGKTVACVLAAKSADIAGPVAVKAASIAGLRREGGWDGARLHPRMSEAEFKAFADHHERGHCADPTLLGPAEVAALPAADRLYLRYQWEAFADVYATLMTARETGGTAAAEEWADLRIVGVLTNGARREQGDAWAYYYTTPAVDAAVDWIKAVGPEAVRGLTPPQVDELARRIVQENTLAPEAHARFAQALPGAVALQDGQPRLGPAVPAAFKARLERALRRAELQLRPGDLAPPAAPPAAPSRAR